MHEREEKPEVDEYPPIPRLSWTQIEIILLTFSTLGFVIGILALVSGWEVSQAIEGERVRFALAFCIIYFVCIGASIRPNLYRGSIVCITRANVVRQARILRNLCLWIQLEAIWLLVLIQHDWIPDSIVIAGSIIFPSTLVAGLTASYRAR